MPRDGVGQGGLARTIGSHDGVDFATADRQVDPFEDLLRACLGGRRNVKITNCESGHDSSELLGVRDVDEATRGVGGVVPTADDGRGDIDQHVVAFHETMVVRDWLRRRQADGFSGTIIEARRTKIAFYLTVRYDAPRERNRSV